jgi:hypothetical protein
VRGIVVGIDACATAIDCTSAAVGDANPQRAALRNIAFYTGIGAFTGLACTTITRIIFWIDAHFVAAHLANVASIVG